MNWPPVLIIGALAAELATLRLLGDRVQGQLLGLTQKGQLWKLLYVLLAPGVILHEAAHAVAAILSGASIAKISLFHPRQTDEGVILGYVLPRYRPRVPGGQLFLALAPLFLPPLALYLLATQLWSVPWSDPETIFSAAAGSMINPTTWLWLFLFASMALSNFPSNQDFRSLGTGSRFITLPLLALLPMIVAVYAPNLAMGATGLYLILASFLAPSCVICLLLALAMGLARRPIY